MSDIKLDGDAAVVGGIHSDSHNTQNNYNNPYHQQQYG